MLFDAPDIIKNIPDISEIYRINDKQIADLEKATEQLENDIFLTEMGEHKIQRWEKMLGIIPYNSSTEERRTRIQAKVLEKLPYSYRVLIRKINTLTSNNCEIELSNNRLELKIKLSLKVKNSRQDLQDMLENVLPLNMIFDVRIQYNTWNVISNSDITWNYAKGNNITWNEIKEEEFE